MSVSRMGHVVSENTRTKISSTHTEDSHGRTY
jgi:hypothetical protein